MNSLELGRLIRARRRTLGWTQTALGWKLTPARSAAAVSAIERGFTGLSIDQITMVAEALGCTVTLTLTPCVCVSTREEAPPSDTPATR